MGIENFMQAGNDGPTIQDFFQQFLDKENIEIKTELSDMDIGIVLELMWQNELRKEENKDKRGMEILVEKILPKLMELRVSRNRKSREEAQQIIKALLPIAVASENALANEVKKV